MGHIRLHQFFNFNRFNFNKFNLKKSRHYFLFSLLLVLTANHNSVYGFWDPAEKIDDLQKYLDSGEFCSRLVGIETGAIQGNNGSGYCEYKGIPFAQPPVGDLRWRAPQKPLQHEGVLQATEMGPDCLQTIPNIPNLAAGSSEDCLYLNVWRPAKPGKYPVMVWIYGGGLLVGSAAWPVYDGANFARKHDVVVVTLNYRLGALGYLSHPLLKAEDPNGSHGNYGALDQVAALEWIQNNILEFDGDPDNVTIFGESAGGWSVCSLMASPLASGLFHKAIIQSGGCANVGSEEEGFNDGEKYVKALGCQNADDVLACMRSKKGSTANNNALKTIFQTNKINELTHRTMMYRPHIDHYFLNDFPDVALAKGEFNVVPLLAGSNQHEHRLFTGILPMGWIPKRLTEAFTRAAIGEDDYDEYKSLYTKREYKATAAAVGAAVMDSNLTCGTYQAVKSVHAQGEAAYYYQYNYDKHVLGWFIGGGHGLELGVTMH